MHTAQTLPSGTADRFFVEESRTSSSLMTTGGQSKRAIRSGPDIEKPKGGVEIAAALKKVIDTSSAVPSALKPKGEFAFGVLEIPVKVKRLLRIIF